MITNVSRTIFEYKMLTSGEKVLVGLSGGADSVALLLSLIELGYEVFACHINHQLRGEESDRDEEFCRELCERLKIILYVEKVDVISICKERKLGIEEGARELRYQVFRKYSGGVKIATAHTLSDSLETTLINLTRGTALKGLCGIPPVREDIIRPLINSTRQDVEDFLRLRNQNYVTDSTNLNDEYTRNKIRLDIIPTLKEINPAIYKSYARMVSSLSLDEAFLEKTARNFLAEASFEDGRYSCEKLKNADRAISSRCIALMLKSRQLECSSKKINEILKIIFSGGKINLSGDVYAVAEKGMLTFEALVQKEKPVFCEDFFPKREYVFLNKLLKASICDINTLKIDKNINKKFANLLLDCDKIQGKAVVRNRRDGDRIKFFGKSHTTSVKKLFNKEVPSEMRDEILFIADEAGVIFIDGFGVSERVSSDGDTKKLLLIEISERH